LSESFETLTTAKGSLFFDYVFPQMNQSCFDKQAQTATQEWKSDWKFRLPDYGVGLSVEQTVLVIIA